MSLRITNVKNNGPIKEFVDKFRVTKTTLRVMLAEIMFSICSQRDGQALSGASL